MKLSGNSMGYPLKRPLVTGPQKCKGFRKNIFKKCSRAKEIKFIALYFVSRPFNSFGVRTNFKAELSYLSITIFPHWCVLNDVFF